MDGVLPQEDRKVGEYPHAALRRILGSIGTMNDDRAFGSRYQLSSLPDILSIDSREGGSFHDGCPIRKDGIGTYNAGV